MGKMIRVNKRDGWQVWPTPYWFHVRGVHLTKRWVVRWPFTEDTDWCGSFVKAVT